VCRGVSVQVPSSEGISVLVLVAPNAPDVRFSAGFNGMQSEEVRS